MTSQLETLIASFMADRKMREIARQNLGNHSSVSDAIQETAILAWEHLDPDHPAPEGWLTLTLKRKCWQINRQSQKGIGVDPPPSYETDVDSSLDIHRGLARLKPAERIALTAFAAGHSYREIQDAHDWTYTKVNRLLAEGRNRLRDLVA